MSNPPDDPQTIDVRVDAAREIREIANDFARPVEILREVIANGYDAGAERMTIVAKPARDSSGRRILDLEVTDDGIGMGREGLECFFGLGFNRKPPIPGRPPIGAKGHGTKIFYNAIELWVATREQNAELLVAHVANARECLFNVDLPRPTMWTGEPAELQAHKAGIPPLGDHGTFIRLIDFTPDSARLIDEFQRGNIENYVRWFTIYGSFRHVVDGSTPQAPMMLLLQATDESTPTEVPYGHPWPQADRMDLDELQKLDKRRPFNFFSKAFHVKDRPIGEGYRIDIAVLFEGTRARRERDPCVRRPKVGGLYLEANRYGLWLCKDHIPIEKSEPLQPDEVDAFATLEPHRALILVNCQEFELTANRGSVGNSQANLLNNVREGVIQYLREIQDDPDLTRFLEEYEEDRLARLRENDRKALQRRINRYNKKKYCRIELPGGETFRFYEPGREITLYGLICQLLIKDPELFSLSILDYDDYRGVDLLVRRGPDPGDLLAKDKVAYTEIKHKLSSQLNHAFAHLHAIICWESTVENNGVVVDATNETFMLTEDTDKDGITHTVLAPRANSNLKHQVRVIVLKRLLQETRQYSEQKNPRPVNGSRRS